jgi:hypothetical protein
MVTDASMEEREKTRGGLVVKQLPASAPLVVL